MKYSIDCDRQSFEKELSILGLDEIGFLKRRRKIVNGMKDQKRSRNTKQQWRSNRYKMMSGIKRFHRSTAGKKFHRQLGRLIALRDFSGLRYGEANSVRVSLLSALTHMYLEHEFYMPITDQVDFELFTEDCKEDIFNFASSIGNGKIDFSEYFEMACRLCEGNALIQAFATKTGKTVKEVEDLWNKAKEITKKEYGMPETEDGFYGILVGILKRMLGLSKKKETSK